MIMSNYPGYTSHIPSQKNPQLNKTKLTPAVYFGSMEEVLNDLADAMAAAIRSKDPNLLPNERAVYIASVDVLLTGVVLNSSLRRLIKERQYRTMLFR